jgi:S1-C subfamily serine protease
VFPYKDKCVQIGFGHFKSVELEHSDRIAKMKNTLVLCTISSLIGAAIAIYWFESRNSANAHAADSHSSVANRAYDSNPLPSDSASALAQLSSGFNRSGTNSEAISELSAEEKVNVSVYQNTNQSVVNIRTITLVADEWRMFAVPSEGAGSGWILDADGHIVTNHHVIADSRQIEVTLFDGRSAPARLVGTDPNTDVAVLKIDVPAGMLRPVVSFADSAKLQVGQKVFAIGNPFGLQRTMTVGIVSSLNRTLLSRNQRTMKSIIQIDAALNRGNSGGPLYDSSSNLIGMNTAIATLTGENTGVGFAVPVNTIRRIADQLIKNGRVIRSTIGIAQVQETPEGLRLISLTRGGPAESSGLRVPKVVRERMRDGDIVYQIIRMDQDYADEITAIDGEPVASFEELLATIESKKPGTRVSVTVLRNGKKIEIPVTLVEDNS